MSITLIQLIMQFTIVPLSWLEFLPAVFWIQIRNRSGFWFRIRIEIFGWIRIWIRFSEYGSPFPIPSSSVYWWTYWRIGAVDLMGLSIECPTRSYSFFSWAEPESTWATHQRVKILYICFWLKIELLFKM